MTTSNAYVGLASANDRASETGATAFLVKMMMGRMATATLVKVTAVSSAGALAAAGRVKVQPLVAMVDGDGNATPHGIIHDVPYFRMQGGSNAVIMDPVVGDVGIAVFASRDISSVKANNGAAANPGSGRRHSMADALYLGGVLNGVPSQVVQFSADGIAITSPTAVKIKAPTVALESDLTVTGQITAGFGTGDSVTVQHHTHPSNGAPPTPGT